MNCIIVDDEQVSRMIVRNFVERIPVLNLVAECESAEDAFKVLKKGNIDAVFLDIEMPGMTGIELVQTLNPLPQIILITSRPDFGAQAFDHNLTDYLVKPIAYDRFEKAVEKACNNLNKSISDNLNKDTVFVKADNKIVRVDFEDIYFVEALSDYVMINVEDRKYVVHYTMKSLINRLPSNMFARVHRSFIVNLNKITEIEDMSINMPQKSIPIGNSYKSNFLAKLNFL